jgi:hypothetical protein
MPISLGDLRAMQGDARSLADDLGVVTRDLTDKELTRFGRSFERQFVLTQTERQIVDIYMRHQAEALLGAMIAKEQMNNEIDDEQPASNKVGGPLPIRACWLGIGDDWEDLDSVYNTVQGVWSVGSPQNWIHSGTLLMGGTAGNAVRIGENAVHVVFGLGSLHSSPKIESVQFTVDGKQKPVLLTFWQQKCLPNGLKVKEFDNAHIWKKDTTVLGKVFISRAFGNTVDSVVDYPYLLGVSYIKEPALRLQDPVTGAGRILPGTVYEVIHTT